jgi:SpoVK/Ycf46/Vps4 family AAA+-type ATPase
MASPQQITALLRSHTVADEERFRAVAMQIAANEAAKGKSEFAAEIKRILAQSGARKAPEAGAPDLQSNSVPFIRLQGELGQLIQPVEPSVGLAQVVLSEKVRARLSRVVREQLHFSRIREHGLRPRQRILLLGPPGCGKTMTAQALAHDLGLPLFVVRLDALFTKFLGETAAKLRVVFDAIETHRAVFLFDEFDSLGLARGAQHDVAEMRRVLNSLLVFIENLRGHSLLVAASNHPDALDPALFRRFDDILRYSAPTKKEIEALLRQRLATQLETVFEWSKMVAAAKGLSLAEIARAADEALKEALIEEDVHVDTELVVTALRERAEQSG